jgi:hypothetical protein
MIRIGKYKNSRQWAVWMKNELVAVVCYKKGAVTIKRLLMDRLSRPADPATGRKQAE